MGTLNIILQLILSLSILVVLHELGHFLPAKWFKTKVEKFYLFFDPWFSLIKTQKGETEYGIGWLPLGGYVKIAGMIDESMDKEQMKKDPQPWEFRSKKPWQKLIIMAGGVIVNFVLGILLLSMIGGVWGERYLLNDDARYGIQVDPLGEMIGLRDGDHIVSVGGNDMKEFSSGVVRHDIVLEDAREIVVNRNGSEVKLILADSTVQKLSTYKSNKYRLFAPRMPAVIGQVGEAYPAGKAGLKEGDIITRIGDQDVEFFDQVSKYVLQSEGDITVRVTRDGRPMNFTLDPTYQRQPKGLARRLGSQPQEIRTLGIATLAPDEVYDFKTRKYKGLASLKYGFSESVGFLSDQFSAFGKMFSGEIKAKESLGGFITIAKIFPEKWDWQRFWRMTAILSLILGFMNLLPIPGLDGGHIFFLLIEMVTGYKFSDRFMEIATTIGFVILIALMLYVNGLDIFRLFQ